MRKPPKGTIVQHWPTFRPGRMMAGFSDVNLAGASSLQDMILYNNATDGTSLAVWDAMVTCETGVTFTPNTFSVGFGVGVRPIAGAGALQGPTLGGAAVGAGVMQVDVTTSGLVDIPYIVLAEPGQWQWPHDWPMFFVPAGYSFICEADARGISGNLGVTFSCIWEWGVNTN